MRGQVAEQTLLFINVIKWVFLATVAGIVVGLGVTFFLKLLLFQ